MTNTSNRVLLAGDVMTGRGVDQILRHPSEPGLHEPAVRDARTYVDLAKAQNGHIPRPVNDAYVWGDAPRSARLPSPDGRLA